VEKGVAAGATRGYGAIVLNLRKGRG